MGEAALYWAFSIVEGMGLPLAILAWVSVFGGSIGMVFVLRRHSMTGRWLPSLVVGGIALLAHLLDYFVTLRLTPDLSLEANPLWRIVVDRMGLGVAKVYGLSGKILVSILSFELFAFYLIQRERLFPGSATGFADFQRRFGTQGTTGWRGSCQNIGSFFAFMFALLGPFFFYITFLNSIGADETLCARLPSLPVVIAAYLILLMLAYGWANYRAFRRGGQARRAMAAGGGATGK